jgi:hypothetical protein
MGDLLCSVVATKKLAMKSPAAVSICLFSIFLFSSGQSPARGQTPSPKPSPSPVVIKAGKLLDARTGKISPNVFILVENHRIKSVGQDAPTGVPVIARLHSWPVVPHILAEEGSLGRAQPPALARQWLYHFA